MQENNNTQGAQPRKTGHYWIKLGGCWRLGLWFAGSGYFNVTGSEGFFEEDEVDEINEEMVVPAEPKPSRDIPDVPSSTYPGYHASTTTSQLMPPNLIEAYNKGWEDRGEHEKKWLGKGE